MTISISYIDNMDHSLRRKVINMKKMLILALAAFLLVSPLHSFADMAAGDMIVTLGENLTEQQKSDLLSCCSSDLPYYTFN